MSNEQHDALLNSWNRNKTSLMNWPHAVPESALDPRPVSTSPFIGELFVHMHYCRLILVQKTPQKWPRRRPRRVAHGAGSCQIAQWLQDNAATVRAAVVSRL